MKKARKGRKKPFSKKKWVHQHFGGAKINNNLGNTVEKRLSGRRKSEKKQKRSGEKPSDQKRSSAKNNFEEKKNKKKNLQQKPMERNSNRTDLIRLQFTTFL